MPPKSNGGTTRSGRMSNKIWAEDDVMPRAS
jgi:hypothetical protein